MSKKKERRIRRLQRVTVFPTVIGMIISLLIIFSLSFFVSTLTFTGITNSIIIKNFEECNTVVQFINENWNYKSRKEIESNLKFFEKSFNDINRIYIDDKNDFLAIFPDLKEIEKEKYFETFEENKMMHFVDPEYGLAIFADDYDHLKNLDKLSDIDTTLNKVMSNGKDKIQSKDLNENLDYAKIDFNFKNFFRALNFIEVLTNKELISWTKKEKPVLHTISIYKTEIPNVNLCFKICYKANMFQLHVLIVLSIFFIVVLIICLIYGILKIVDLILDRNQITKLISTDVITGGNNKNYFTIKARKLTTKSRKNYAVVQLRLEKYKNFCTAFGLKQGENLLEKINATLAIFVNKKELVSHAEEADFLLLLLYQNEETLNIRIRNLMSILQEQNKEQKIYFTAGVCTLTKKEDISSIISYAGIAIPRLPHMQNEIAYFNEEMKENLVWERHIEDDMEKALINHEFQVYLQPKYSTKKEVLSAAEALVRWTHPVLGFISPGKFIPLFEKNGFILQLDDYMLTEVSRIQATWLSQGKKLVPISVNVSRAHFAEDNLAEHICSIVDKFKVPHECIELELTESAFFDDKNTLLTTIRKLKSFGFKVSMDDFGAGYSSLNSLKELPLDIIKLDGEFFRSVDDIKRSNLIVGETITLAKKLGMEIVAEGIETREQVDFLAKNDCDLIQGFYFSKPLPIKEFEKKAYGGK